jgi:hypothetical protein
MVASGESGESFED